MEIFEDGDHLGHHVTQEADHHQQGDAGEQHRVGQGQDHLVLQLLLEFDVIGQSFENLIEAAGTFPGGDGGPEKIGEDGGEVAQGRSQGLTLLNPGAQRRRHLLHGGLFGLIGDHLQPLVQGRAGADHGGQLPGKEDQGGHAHRETAAEQAARSSPLLLAADLLHRQRDESLLAELLTNLAGGVAGQNPALLAPFGINGGIFVGAH